MAVSQILIETILFAIILATISITYRDKSVSKDREGSHRFFMLINAYIVGVIGYVIVYLLEESYEVVRYALYIVVWYSYVTVLACMILQAVYIFEHTGKKIRITASLLCYYGLFTVIIELFFHNFTFDSNPTGLEFCPYAIPKPLYYSIPILTYYFCMIFLMQEYHKSHLKVREKHLLKLGIAATIPSFIGLIVETVCHVFFDIRYPVFFITMIVSVKLMSDMHLESRSFKLKREDFDEFLRDDNTDAVYICDDELTVLYENKAASIYSAMYKDTYIGRKLTDIFVIDSDVKRALTSKDARDGLMVPAIYTVTDRKLVLSVEYMYDCCDEILCSIITVPNYKVAMSDDTFGDARGYSRSGSSNRSHVAAVNIDKDETAPSIQDIRTIDPNSNILLIDENSENLDSYEELMKPYNVHVHRAISGRAAIEMMAEPCYDALFIAYAMEKLNGVETAKRIRGMGEGYYTEVPIIFILNEPVVNIYQDLLEVSFNDFLEMPLSVKKLNAIMTRWLWRRYAVTDLYNGSAGSTRIVRSMKALEEMNKDCKKFNDEGNFRYIGYNLKGMKRICTRLENRQLINACDNMLEIYLRGQYDKLGEYLEQFESELERLKDSTNFGMLY